MGDAAEPGAWPYLDAGPRVGTATSCALPPRPKGLLAHKDSVTPAMSGDIVVISSGIAIRSKAGRRQLRL